MSYGDQVSTVFQVDGHTNGAATGIKITGNAAASGVAVTTLSTGDNENLTIDAKGTGSITIGGTSTGGVVLGGAISSATSLTSPVLIFNGATGANEIRVPINLADALSIEDATGDIMTIDTTTGTIVVAFGAAVRVNVAGDAQIGSATTDLVAFHGSTPTDQCAAYTQTYSTADRTHAAATAAALTVTDGAGTNDGTIPAIGTGGASADQADVIAAVQELADQINKLVADQLDTKQLVNAIIDDLQEKGLVG